MQPDAPVNIWLFCHQFQEKETAVADLLVEVGSRFSSSDVCLKRAHLGEKRNMKAKESPRTFSETIFHTRTVSFEKPKKRKFCYC